MARALEAAEPELGVELVPIRTSGDVGSGVTAGMERHSGGAGGAGGVRGDKSRFTKEIEEALLDGRVDLGVHSAKDVPGELPDGLAIISVPERGDPLDSLVGAPSLAELREGARVGTSSLRRRSQLLAARPDLDVRELRGNVDTRLRRLEEDGYDALVLAAAGLVRLGRDGGARLPPEQVVPAAGQGCLALEARADDRRVAALAGPLTDRRSLVRLTAERALVTALDATCRTPIGAHAEVAADRLSLSAYVGLPDGSVWIRDSLEGDPADPSALGAEVAARLSAAGADEILAQAERSP